MLEIIDTAGQEEYKTLRDIYFKDSDGFILVYSICNESTFQHAQRLKDKLTQIHGPGKPIILAGNKLDLEKERDISEEEAYQYAVGQQVGFFECSAKEMINVAELFSGAVRLIDRQRKNEAMYNSNNNPEEEEFKNGAPSNGASSGGGQTGGKRLSKMCVVL